MEIGDRIRIDGMTGRVVALISEGRFSPDYPAEQWAYLEVGTLVDTDEAGLIHYQNFDGVQVERISN
ncbi:hypothetical protein UB31_20280 [Bradyrhizobium sp. LTSP849]|jgi:hypothetical protein|uniref:hypothetical protein n=1 Tax=unclassified Bradyrhizobium TaxID=2631580 RepID=UPI0005D2C29A|nr:MULTISPECIES: hypothetical protein [unclassified Bradyrhizobium]KJC41573.1 hypothetical protein UP06_24015 [Bradyrhizobium sp. LTSP857]KJC45984.1 hypothetical protein UB31_20280 [Bradyrhizobium sp. LTSP849]